MKKRVQPKEPEFEDDGQAIDLITSKGGKVNKGVIDYQGKDLEVFKAIDYPIYEWDYILK